MTENTRGKAASCAGAGVPSNERTDVLNPGSSEALAAGCRCPVLDNGHGRGYLGGVKDPDTGEVLFVQRGDCPLHGWEAAS